MDGIKSTTSCVRLPCRRVLSLFLQRRISTPVLWTASSSLNAQLGIRHWPSSLLHVRSHHWCSLICPGICRKPRPARTEVFLLPKQLDVKVTNCTFSSRYRAYRLYSVTCSYQRCQGEINLFQRWSHPLWPLETWNYGLATWAPLYASRVPTSRITSTPTLWTT